MNKQFIIKMMQAKQLQYEAFKEIMPEGIVKRIEKLENELIELARDCFASCISGRCAGADKSNTDTQAGNIRKVSIE